MKLHTCDPPKIFEVKIYWDAEAGEPAASPESITVSEGDIIEFVSADDTPFSIRFKGCCPTDKSEHCGGKGRPARLALNEGCHKMAHQHSTHFDEQRRKSLKQGHFAYDIVMGDRVRDPELVVREKPK